MPSTTFFNLPPEKREKLLSAARAEFARVPYAEASINKMIQAADIPRGSFYMYFRDKKELFLYLMGEYGQRLIALMEKLLERRQGDIFAAFLDLFDRIQAEYRDPEKKERYQHIMGIVRNNSGVQLFSLLGMEDWLPIPGRLVEWVDPRLLDLRSADDLEKIFCILIDVTGQAVLRGIQAEDPAAVRSSYLRMLDILKRGMARKQPETQHE
ncbi:TetR family transcriptional regulator [uncultured Pseudoflavonifractor sp.]|uniref:TetR family transcriptional regulator n=1 Tax=uncultured Pseudoflavonifractor sp. TaxID=1221379 RepID=UPI0025FF4BB6|nr:TetR family transcriptional regulator [uncultured Pseudoflavonifractor sp.]